MYVCIFETGRMIKAMYVHLCIYLCMYTVNVCFKYIYIYIRHCF